MRGGKDGNEGKKKPPHLSEAVGVVRVSCPPFSAGWGERAAFSPGLASALFAYGRKILAAPAVGGVDDGPRLCDALQQVQRILNDGALLVGVARLSEWLPVGVFHVECAGRLDTRGLVQTLIDHHRRDAMLFQHPCDQPAGLIAPWSCCADERGVNILT